MLHIHWIEALCVCLCAWNFLFHHFLRFYFILFFCSLFNRIPTKWILNVIDEGENVLVPHCHIERGRNSDGIFIFDAFELGEDIFECVKWNNWILVQLGCDLWCICIKADFTANDLQRLNISFLPSEKQLNENCDKRVQFLICSFTR